MANGYSKNKQPVKETLAVTDEPRQPNRPPADKKPPISGNAVWYLLPLGILGALLLLTMVGPDSQVELSYMDLVKLIEQGARHQ